MQQEVTYQKVLSELERLVSEREFRKDKRRPITDRTFESFSWGWKYSVKNGSFRHDTLRQLSWQNLGYRMAKHFGDQSLENIQYAFRILRDNYNEKIRGNK